MPRDYKKEYRNEKKSRRKRRVELNRYNREKGTYGNGDGKDASHSGGKITGFVKASVNRGKKGEGGRKKGVKHNYPKNRKSPGTGTRKSTSTGKRS
jgi:hypothetical protein|tara:strand:+ start:2438 stop:2725 length:288 start_codon:yes stop_codon:yes gene_type:complete